jgi:hypothetical protein
LPFCPFVNDFICRHRVHYFELVLECTGWSSDCEAPPQRGNIGHLRHAALSFAMAK